MISKGILGQNIRLLAQIEIVKNELTNIKHEPPIDLENDTIRKMSIVLKFLYEDISCDTKEVDVNTLDDFKSIYEEFKSKYNDTKVYDELKIIHNYFHIAISNYGDITEKVKKVWEVNK